MMIRITTVIALLAVTAHVHGDIMGTYVASGVVTSEAGNPQASFPIHSGDAFSLTFNLPESPSLLSGSSDVYSYPAQTTDFTLQVDGLTFAASGVTPNLYYVDESYGFQASYNSPTLPTGWTAPNDSGFSDMFFLLFRPGTGAESYSQVAALSLANYSSIFFSCQCRT